MFSRKKKKNRSFAKKNYQNYYFFEESFPLKTLPEIAPSTGPILYKVQPGDASGKGLKGATVRAPPAVAIPYRLQSRGSALPLVGCWVLATGARELSIPLRCGAVPFFRVEGGRCGLGWAGFETCHYTVAGLVSSDTAAMYMLHAWAQ